MKKVLIYDGSFDGFLTAVYHVFENQLKDVEIVKPKQYQPNIFIESEEILTNNRKAKRVWQALQIKVTNSVTNRLYAGFLSEIKGVENALLRFIISAYSSESFMHTNYENKDVLRINQVSKMVFRERNRMEAIAKFQLTKDGIYFATVEPEFNVLPLLLKYAKDKYPDCQWIIYDKKRRIGVHCIDGVIQWINQEEFFSRTSRLLKKKYHDSLFLDSNHLRIIRKKEFKSVV